ncbi:MAG: UbiA family prenyltransferase [Candidatus Krumholzibacteriota bacterium]|nr:UbiA family prenyltransferase [Candidatus Krumholzibacteriota bacterium]
MPGSAREFLETIKVEHTIFALPFAFMTLFLVSGGWPSGSDFVWVSVAMVAGRTFGMAANRLIDARLDARNPRTADRAIAAGRLTPRAVVFYMLVTMAVFLLAVWQLHPVCRKLWPVVIAALVIYPYAKRFTAAAHLFLGAVYFMIPTAIWLAVTGTLERPALLLGVGAGLWVAGFDIIYALLDVESDRRAGLHSMPADLGLAPALWISRLFHVGFVACLGIAGIDLAAGAFYYAGLGLTAVLLGWEHRLVSARDLSRVNAAFFTTNGVVSVVLFVFIAADTVL